MPPFVKWKALAMTRTMLMLANVARVLNTRAQGGQVQTKRTWVRLCHHSSRRFAAAIKRDDCA